MDQRPPKERKKRMLMVHRSFLLLFLLLFQEIRPSASIIPGITSTLPVTDPAHQSTSVASDPLRVLQQTSDIFAAFSRFTAEQLGDDADTLFVYPLFKDLGLPIRAIEYIVRSFGCDENGLEKTALREKAPELAALITLLRTDAALLLPVTLWARSKTIKFSTRAVLTGANPEEKLDLTTFVDAVCDGERKETLWPQDADIGQGGGEDL